LAFGSTPDGIKPNAIRIVRIFVTCQAIGDGLAKQSGSAVLEIFARALIPDNFASSRGQPKTSLSSRSSDNPA
jgi:hypothetical protein